MTRFTMIAAALGMATVALPSAASAQAFQSINARQANLFNRIDQGIRSGALNRAEAAQLKVDFRALNQREATYRRTGGLSGWERQDLNRRFDALSARVRVQKHDRQGRR